MGCCIKKEYTINDNEIIFLHYLLRARESECQPLKIDQEPFINLIAAKTSNPTNTLIDLNEALKDLGPLMKVSDRLQNAKSRLIASIIFIVLVIVLVGVYIFLLNTVSSSNAIAIIIGYFILLVVFMIVFFVVLYRIDRKFRDKIKAHLKMLNDTKYGYRGLEWYSKNDPCGGKNNKSFDYIGIKRKNYLAGNIQDF